MLQAFQNLPTREVPNELHAAIVRAAAFRRFWKYVIVLTIVIGLAFLLSLWHLYTRIVEIEAFTSIRAVADTLDPTFDSILDSFKTIVDFLPTQTIAITLLNFIALIFMTLVLRSFSRLEAQFKM